MKFARPVGTNSRRPAKCSLSGPSFKKKGILLESWGKDPKRASSKFFIKSISVRYFLP